jgi:sigma-B regulation protein RsbU (phosphoserine phosphatase)
MNGPYRYLRRRLHDAGLKPRSTLARLGLVLLVLVLGLTVARRLIDFAWPGRGTALAGWATFFTFILCIVAFLLGLRWVRQRLMWRLRNRLIVTYVFMGVIPIVLLLALAGITAYWFTNQFATFLVTNDIQSELRILGAENSVFAANLARQLKDGKIPAELNKIAPGDRGTVWYQGKPVVVWGSTEPLKAPPTDERDFRAVMLDQSMFYLRVAKSERVGNNQLVVVASRALDQKALEHVVGSLGQVSLYQPDRKEGGPPKQGITIRSSSGNSDYDVEYNSSPVSNRSKITAGKVSPSTAIYDWELDFPAFFAVKVEDRSNEQRPVVGEAQALLIVTTRPSLIAARLFQTLGDFASNIMLVIAAIAIFFGIIELVAFIIGIRLTRTMTGSIAALYQATQHVNKGDLTHRIKIRSSDQLAALETSFNSMTVSLQRLMEEQKQKQRLESELAIAQEVQALLFPRDITELESLEVHGICKPARTVSGDYYDFLPISANRLGIAVGDISGKGISAALLMATVHAFVRAYTLVEQVPALALPAAVGGPTPQQSSSIRMSRRDGEELPPGTLMCMLNHQLYKSTPSEKYATMFLSFYDQRTRKLQYANAGHLPPIVLGNDGTVRRLDTSGLVVGLFGDMTYPDDEITMNAGDIFIAYSDGITEPENEFGEFGEDRLIELVQENRDLPLARISEIVTQAVSDWIGGGEQPDDVTLVLARTR